MPRFFIVDCHDGNIDPIAEFDSEADAKEALIHFFSVSPSGHVETLIYEWPETQNHDDKVEEHENL